MSYYKNYFSNDSTENFPEFFKIFVSLEFDRSSLFFNLSKCEEENQFFSLRSLVPWILSRFLSTSRTFLHLHLDSCPIPLEQLDFNF